MAVEARGQAGSLAYIGARVFSVGALPQRLANVFLRTGAVWYFGAGALLLFSLTAIWIQVPLVDSWTSWLLPIDLGWGIHSSAISYGVLVAVIACYCFWHGGRIADWPALALAGRRSGTITRPRSLLWLTALVSAPTALALFQLLFVDFSLLATLQDDENQYLLLTRHLGYSLLAQHYPLGVFQFSINGTLDRFSLVVELAGPGMVAPLLAGILCLVGAYLSQPDARSRLALASWGALGGQHSATRAAVSPPDNADEDTAVEDTGMDWARWRGPLIAAAVVIGLIIFGRAPAGLVAKSQGLAALNQGHYQTALSDFAWATALTPSLEDLPHFRVERGQALYLTGDTATLDSGIYLASEYTDIHAQTQAWAVERELLRQYPGSVPLKLVTAKTGVKMSSLSVQAAGEVGARETT